MLPDYINVTIIAFQLEIAVIRAMPGLHHFLDKHFALIDIEDSGCFLTPVARVALDSQHEATNLLDLEPACSGGQVPITRAMVIVVATLALLTLSIALGVFLARTTLDLVVSLLGASHQPLIRWHVVAFSTMLFWIWYFAPRLFALQ